MVDWLIYKGRLVSCTDQKESSEGGPGIGCIYILHRHGTAYNNLHIYLAMLISPFSCGCCPSFTEVHVKGIEGLVREVLDCFLA